MNILLVFGNSQAPFPGVNESLCRDLVAYIPPTGVRLYTPPNERFVPLLRSARQTSAGATSVAMGFTLITDLASVRRPFRAVFLGGGQREFELFQALHGLVPCFPVASTGGAALHMLDKASPSFSAATERDLRGGISFASLWARIVSDVYPTIVRPGAVVAPATPTPPTQGYDPVPVSSPTVPAAQVFYETTTATQTITFSNDGGFNTLLLNNPRR